MCIYKLHMQFHIKHMHKDAVTSIIKIAKQNMIISDEILSDRLQISLPRHTHTNISIEENVLTAYRSSGENLCTPRCA